MSTDPTSFCAKDGLYYQSYMEYRAANMKHNEAVLKAAGLDEASFRALHQASNSPDKKINSRRSTPKKSTPRLVVTPTLTRRVSSRVRKVAPPTVMNEATRSDEQYKPKAKRQKKQEVSGSLTERELSQLREEVDWLDEMEAYLKDEENLSYQNYCSVMRQVKKLVTGKGVTYLHWDEGTYFYYRSRITLSDDFDAMYEEACAFEDKHGKDLGNGTYAKNDRFF